MKPREVVIPLVVGLAVALAQALFAGPDLIRLIVYFFGGLALAGVGVVLSRAVRERGSHPEMNGLVRAPRMEADRHKTAPVESSTAKNERVWGDVKPEDLLAIDHMDNLTRNERDRLLEPYIGQWLTVDGAVDDVQGKANDPTVYVYIREREHRVVANFKNDKVRASSLRKGIPIRVMGSFHHVQGYIESIFLEDCEFAARDRPTPPLPPPAMRESAKEKPGDVRAPINAMVAGHGAEFSGVGVGKTETFTVTNEFGFKWTPNAGIVIGGLHARLNGIPHTWTFDNNMNPYFPAKYAPPPDIPGDCYFTVDNIKAGTPWTITILHEHPYEWQHDFTIEDEIGPKIDFDKQAEVRLAVKVLQGTQWRFGLKFSRGDEFSKGRYSSGYPLWHLQKEQNSDDLAFTHYDELGRGRGALLCRDYANQEIGIVIKRVGQQLIITVDCNPTHIVTFDARSHRFALATAWADGREFKISVRCEVLVTDS